MANYLEARVSLFTTVLEQEPSAFPRVGDVLSDIRSGTYLSKTAPLLFILKEEGVDAYTRAKSALPAFTPAAQLRTRSKDVPLADAVLAYTGVVYFDIDHLDTQALMHLRTELARWPCLVFYFLSPSQQGLKVGLAAEGIHDAFTYAQAWKQGADRFAAIGVAVDNAPKSPKSLCFVSTDGLAHVNDAITPFRVDPPPPRAPRPERPCSGNADESRVRSALEAIPNADCDYEMYVKIGMALHSENQGWQALWDDWARTWPTYNQRDQDAKWKSFDGGKGVGLGTLFEMAARYHWHDPLRRERHDIPPGDTHREETPGEPHKEDGLADLHDMLDRTYPAQHWLIKDLIPAGLTFVIGSPKSSKTYLAYSLALALAYEAKLGGKWLEQYDVLAPGPVVYFSLEDDEADSMSRIRELAPWLTSENVPAGRLLFKNGFDVPRCDDGLVDYLKTQILDVYHPALLVLDPVSYLMAPTRKGADQFSEVKDMLLPLRWLGKDYQCSILAVDHRRKKSSDDVDIFETLQGSNAKIAVADSLLLLVRDDKEVTIHTRVRRGPDQTLTLGFEFAGDGTARWLWKSTMGGHTSSNYGAMRVKVLQVLELGVPMSIPDLMAAADVPPGPASNNAMRQLLFRLQKSGEIVKTSRGLYVGLKTG